MRNDNTLPSFFTRFPEAAAVEPSAGARQGPDRISADSPSAQTKALSHPGVIVDISPEGWAAYARGKAAEPSAAGGVRAAGKITAAEGLQECETCKNRRYQDVSNDPSVSFQTPTHISPGQAAAQVMAHESEHVSHEQAKAERDGRRVISQNVTLETSICPECGRVYVSGGVTRTVTADDKHDNNKDNNEAALI